MSISRTEMITVLSCLDELQTINDLQELLQFVVECDYRDEKKYLKRVVLMSELYLSQVTPLLQNLTIRLKTIQEGSIQTTSN